MKLRDYFVLNDVLTMSLLLFRVLNVVVALPSMQGQRQLSDFIKNILIYFPKMNEGLTDLEQLEGEQVMTQLSFLGDPSL